VFTVSVARANGARRLRRFGVAQAQRRCGYSPAPGKCQKWSGLKAAPRHNWLGRYPDTENLDKDRSGLANETALNGQGSAWRQEDARSNLKGCQILAGGKAEGRHPRNTPDDKLDPGGVAESFISGTLARVPRLGTEKTGCLRFTSAVAANFWHPAGMLGPHRNACRTIWPLWILNNAA